MENEHLNIAAIQMRSVPGNIQRNREQAEILIKQALKKKAEIILLPELFNVGYELQLIPDLNYDFDHEVRFYSNLAATYQTTLICGLLEKVERSFYNSLFVFDNKGQVLANYRKTHLFPLNAEKKIFKEGTESSTFHTGPFKIGLSICYDLRFPELFRKYADLGCNAILIASAWPFPRLDHWTTLLKSHAILNQLYIIAANRVGHDGDFWFLGNSCIIDPWGTMLNSMNESDEGIIISEISSSMVAAVRSKIPSIRERQNKHKP